MKALVFSLRSIYHLQKVAQRVHATTGRRYALSDQEALVSMLRAAAGSRDPSVEGYLSAFAGHLDRATLRELSRRGIELAGAARAAA